MYSFFTKVDFYVAMGDMSSAFFRRVSAKDFNHGKFCNCSYWGFLHMSSKLQLVLNFSCYWLNDQQFCRLNCSICPSTAQMFFALITSLSAVSSLWMSILSYDSMRVWWTNLFTSYNRTQLLLTFFAKLIFCLISGSVVAGMFPVTFSLWAMHVLFSQCSKQFWLVWGRSRRNVCHLWALKRVPKDLDNLLWIVVHALSWSITPVIKPWFFLARHECII